MRVVLHYKCTQCPDWVQIETPVIGMKDTVMPSKLDYNLARVVINQAPPRTAHACGNGKFGVAELMFIEEALLVRPTTKDILTLGK